MRNGLKVTVHTNRDGIEVTFPARWVICGACDGNATTTRHIECDGGGFTAEEFDRHCDGDEDFAENYFGGYYDRPCPDCKGLGRVQVIDEEAVRGWRQKTLLAEYHRQMADNRAIDREQEMERRMGA
jgi:RecJ-like exonuclease